MTNKAREATLLERLRKAGIEPLVDQRDAPFKFLISPMVTAGVNVRLIALKFMDETFRRIQSASFASTLSGIVFLPKILDPQMIKSNDFVSYKRSDKSVHVGLNISFAEWTRASPGERVDMFADNLVESINRISPKRLLPDDRQKLLAVLRDVRRTMKSTFLN